MTYALAFLRWLLGLFVDSTKAVGATEEREKIETAHEAHLQRQNKVASRPVTDDELQKSLKDGTF